MKDIRITYTYHKKNFDLDEEPTTGTIVLPVEDTVAADLLSSDLSQTIAGRHIGRPFHCICEMLLWYCSMHLWYIQGDDKNFEHQPGITSALQWRQVVKQKPLPVYQSTERR